MVHVRAWYPDINFASVEYPFIEARLIAWLGYQHKVDGFLFWHQSLEEMYRFDETTCYQPDFQWSNITGTIGDGQFSTGIDGVLPSIRLANLRDGSEDYDYLTLLGKIRKIALRPARTTRLGQKLYKRPPETKATQT